MDKIQDMLTIKETARLLKKTTKTVYRYRDAGLLEVIRKGNQYFVSQESIDKLMKNPVQLEDFWSREIRLLSGRVEELEKAVEGLSFQVEALIKHHEVRHEREIVPETPQMTDISSTEMSNQVTKSGHFSGAMHILSREDLPGDALLLTAFAMQEGINRITLLSCVRDHGMPHYAMAKLTRPKEADRWVTREQQEIIRQHRATSH